MRKQIIAAVAACIAASVMPVAQASDWTVHAARVLVDEGEVVMTCVPNPDDHPTHALGGFTVVNAPSGSKPGGLNSFAAFAGVRTSEETASFRVNDEGVQATVPVPEPLRPSWDLPPMHGSAARPSILTVMWAVRGGEMPCKVTVGDTVLDVPAVEGATVVTAYLRDFSGGLSLEAGASVAHDMHYSQDLSGEALVFFNYGYGEYAWSGPEGQGGGGTSTPNWPSFNAFSGPTDGTWNFALTDSVNLGLSPKVFALAVPLSVLA